MFDSSLAFRPGLRFWLPGPVVVWLTSDTNEVSRFSCVQFLSVRTALGLRPRPSKTRTSRNFRLLLILPSRCKHSVGTRIVFFEARFLARRCLCLHNTRAPHGARRKTRGQDGFRFSFLAGLFHPRLHAGLSRRLRLPTRAARFRAAVPLYEELKIPRRPPRRYSFETKINGGPLLT